MVGFTYYCVFFFQAEDGIRDLVRSRGLGDVYKRQSDSAASGKTSGAPRRAFPGKQEPRGNRSGIRPDPVSYTHLTLPTIYSV